MRARRALVELPAMPVGGTVAVPLYCDTVLEGSCNHCPVARFDLPYQVDSRDGLREAGIVAACNVKLHWRYVEHDDDELWAACPAIYAYMRSVRSSRCFDQRWHSKEQHV